MDDRDAIADLADIHRVLAGDRGAFRPLVERYADRVHAFCRSRGLGDEEAADLSQEIFLRAYRSLHSFRLGESFPSWLFAIAANRVRTHGSRLGSEGRKLDAIRNEEETRDGPDSVTEAERALEAEAIRAAVSSLPEEQRRVVELYYFAELPVLEVAEILGLGEEAVKSRLFRARKRLKSLLQGGDDEQPARAEKGNEG